MYVLIKNLWLTILALLTAAAAFAFCPARVYAADTPAEPAHSEYISWTFYSYEKPDFTSKKIDIYEPQTVNVLESGDGGWSKISTYHGPGWVNTKFNRYFVDSPKRLYNNKNGRLAVSEISSQIVNIISADGNWICIDSWLGPKWINLTVSPGAPAGKGKQETLLSGVPIYSQRKEGLTSGCEIVSAAMMINYSVKADIKTLVSKMPRSNNPNIGFRGNVYADGFTIYPSGLLSLVRQYLGSAVDMSTDRHKCTMDDIKAKIDAGHPVVVWVNGLSFNVHAVCITGYNADGFYYNDPWTGQKNAFIKYGPFYGIWNKPIADRLNYKNTPYCKALSY